MVGVAAVDGDNKKGILLLLSLIVAITFLKNSNLQFISSLFTLLVIFPYKHINIALLKKALFLVVPLAVGLIGIFFNSLSDVLRDLFYFSGPLLYALIGYSLARQWNVAGLLRLFTLLGLLYSTIDILLSAKQVIVDREFNFLMIRDNVSAGNAITLISLFILLFYRKFDFELGFSRKERLLGITINIVAFFLFGSRTYLLVGIVLLCFLLFNRISWKFALFAVLPALIIGAVFLVSTSSGGGGEITFTAKMMASISEMAIADYSDLADMTANLRGFEAFMALDSFTKTTVFGQITGQGFGALIDLQTFIPYGETERRFVPIIHNGYFFILVKLGLLGIFVYLGWFISLYRSSVEVFNTQLTQQHALFLRKNLKACVLSLFLTNMVITGIFNPETAFLQMFIFATFCTLKVENI